MRIKVNPHSIKIIERNSVNEKEININKCYFEFSEEITNDYVKEAYFTLGEHTYKQIIQNNECSIPYEVLEQKGRVEIGVVAFKVEDEETIKRYNPMPTTINTLLGSLKDADNSEPVTPSDKEQMEQILQDGLEDIQEAIEKAERVDITATKEGTITTIVITKQDGTTETVHVDDGVGLQFKWQGTSLGVKREDQEHYEYVNLKGEKGDAGSIKFIVVQQLPTEDIDTTAIYLVPLEEPESQENRYAEYIYVDNKWELLGKIGIQVDLSDYYTKQEVNTELAKKQPLINNDNKLPYSLISGTPDLSNYITKDVNNLTYYYDKNYIDTTVGNIETILTRLDVGSGI